MTELISLSCNHCGAPIKVSETSRFVTCGHCNSSLEIKKTEGIAYTEVMDALAEVEQNNAALMKDVKNLRRQQDLDQLDQRWKERKRTLGNTDGSIPSVYGAMLAGGVCGCFGLILIIAGLASNSAEEAIVPGVLSLGMGAVMFIFGKQRAEKYEHGYQDYRRKRNRLWKGFGRRGRRGRHRDLDE